ncbi:RusA family crossover junction endodeoxyribonuclease [Cohnella cholangitidis]|uniref:RusA family crossover junction endodeoxyribonuclease n=1 Tax=Cohnella cholangitidis TaxID=2598458 RepID=A0A7G5BTF3_9BACL|nr:RusA family crossover junction endodeoxyribonuclease [Cohnella cholangitidis]QMV40237.1 RusA family crossover junction endodeoxyribonuclease [Cohnella cholangitidis]
MIEVDQATLLARLWRNKSGWQTAKGKVVVNLWYYFPDNRIRDTHNGQKLLLDCLEDAGIYTNDRYALPRVIDWQIDRTNPRIEMEIYKLQEVAS